MKELEKLKKKGVDPALYLEMKAATAKRQEDQRREKEKDRREKEAKEGKEGKEGKEKKPSRFKLGGRPLVGNAFIG